MKIYRPTGQEIFEVLKANGFTEFFRPAPYLPNAGYIIGPFTVTGIARLSVVYTHLRSVTMKEVFIEGNLHHLHADVGKRRTDFRSKKGLICDGALQFVIDLDESGRFYSDIDDWNPYQGLKNKIGHAWEVIGPRIFGREELPRNG